jgi:carbon storage regulator
MQGSPFWKGIAMLVLSRRVNEKIVLPNLGVTVEVIELKGQRVRLGITAPANVRVTRQELLVDKSCEPDRHADSSDSRFDLPHVTGI